MKIEQLLNKKLEELNKKGQEISLSLCRKIPYIKPSIHIKVLDKNTYAEYLDNQIIINKIILDVIKEEKSEKKLKCLLEEVLVHEYCHHFTDFVYRYKKNKITPHGRYFKQICKFFGIKGKPYVWRNLID